MKKLLAMFFLFVLVANGADFKSLKIGEAAPAFSLKNYDGKEFSLQNLLKDNKLVVVMFISTQCPVSNGYNDRMVKLDGLYGKKGVKFIGINANVKETVNDIAEHSKAHGFGFPVLKDEQNKIADAYGAQVTPETFIIDPQGKLMYHGRIDDSRNPEKVQTQDLALALDALLTGKQPLRTETKAFGCSIKRTVAD
jgi:peroxiredoxin